MSRLIDIPAFKGLYRSGDSEDITLGYLLECQNLRPFSGVLEKTFGYGVRIDSALPAGCQGVAVLVNSLISGGYQILGMIVNQSTNVMTLYEWTGTAWSQVATYYIGTNPYYQVYGQNPVLLDEGVIRLLPGAIATGIGMWYGVIDRTIFDGNVQWDELLVGYPTWVDKPALTMTATTMDYLGSGFLAADRFNYKLSAVYDGGQESLLCVTPTRWTPGAADKAVRLTITGIDITTMNKRLTALKLYRQKITGATGVVDTYRHIHTIDFLRPATDIKTAATGGETPTKKVFIPDLISYDFDASATYSIQLSGAGSYYDITNPGAGTGTEWFTFDSFDPGSRFDVAWSLVEAPLVGSPSEVASGTSGAYTDAIQISEQLTDEYSRNAILKIVEGANTEYAGVDRAFFYWLVLHSQPAETYANAEWIVVTEQKGLFIVSNSGTAITIEAFDTNLTDGAEHPLDGEISVKVNGKFARIIGGQKWQANIVLDPGGKNEVHEEWVAYSETDQYDVDPVSNVLKISDRAGGAITGLASSFGRPVVMKPHSIVTIDNSGVPAQAETAHQIGNLAPYGYIDVAGDVYVCYIDGIYRLRPNNLAATDQTPTERLRITDPLKDDYLVLTLAQKQAIRSGYDPTKGEILWTWGSKIWAFNISSQEWREIVTGVTVGFMLPDENNQIMLYDSNDRKLYSGDTEYPESTTMTLKSKTFSLFDVEYEVIRFIYFTYKSSTTLTMNIYSENSSTPLVTWTLPVKTVTSTERVPVKIRVKKFNIEIVGPTGITGVTIGKIRIEHD